MIATLNGKIVLALAPKKGVSSRGNEWVSQDFVIEDDNGEKLAFNVFGQDKLNEYNLSVGTKASVTVSIESREWQGKWFTSVRCTGCISNSTPIAPQETKATPSEVAQPTKSKDSRIEDMPF